MERMAAGEFKLNCGMICLDFLIRHGFITPDTGNHTASLVSPWRKKLLTYENWGSIEAIEGQIFQLDINNFFFDCPDHS